MEKINWLDYKGTANPISDAYREICVNFQKLTGGKDIKCIAFTSLQTTAEHSSVVAGLGIALAQGGQKVLLVDRNRFSPAQHILFDLPNRGISGNRTNDTDLQDGVQHCLEQGNLDILTGGTMKQNENTTLTSDAVRFLFIARNSYDYILIDMPSLDAGADAILISPHIDGVVLILTSGIDKLNDLADAKVRLEQAGGKLLGCVLNEGKFSA